MKKAAILGTGVVGQTLAGGFLKHGYTVVMGTKNPGKKLEWKGFAGTPPEVTTYEKAAASADILVLAVKGTVAEDVIKAVAPHAAGKSIIDATNPIADAPPDEGVLKFFTTLDSSLMERLQKLAPQAHLVKAFSSVGKRAHGESTTGRRTSDHVYLRQQRGSEEGSTRHPGRVWVGNRRHGRSGSSSGDRTAMHPVVYPGLYAEPVDACIQVVAEVDSGISKPSEENTASRKAQVLINCFIEIM